jgi:cob(I)alamin adenosyltransferase
MKSENMIANPFILKYLNRLSDLIFLLACFEEKDDEEKREINF